MHGQRPALILPLLLAMIATPSIAQQQADSPAALQKVLDCRSIADGAARLACFDAGVARLDQARTNGDVAIVDREEVRRTRRGLFGFNLPNLAIFGGHNGNDPRKAAMDGELKEISGRTRAVAQNGYSGLIITLEDGARWEQTDSVALGRSPKPGDTVTIKRAAMGSFKMNFAVGPSFRVRRIG